MLLSEFVSTHISLVGGKKKVSTLHENILLFFKKFDNLYKLPVVHLHLFKANIISESMLNYRYSGF